MSQEQARTIETQQKTIRNQLVTIEQQRTAIGDALTMLRAGYVAQAVKDLERARSGGR